MPHKWGDHITHPALTSGNNAHAAQGIRMTDASRRQPAIDQTPHPVPDYAAVLTAPRDRAMPEPAHLEPKQVQRWAVGRHPIVTDVAAHDRPQPLAHLRDGVVHASLEFGFHRAQLGLQPLANRLPQDRKLSIAPLLPADVREAEKVEGFRFPLSALLPILGRERSELQKTRFLGMQFQVELSHSFAKLCPEPFGIRFPLKANYDVVGKPHDDHVTASLFPTPRLGPQVEHVVQVNVGQQRRCTAALGRSLFYPCPFPLLQHAGMKLFLDQPYDASVRYPVLDELHQPFVRYSVEKAANIQIQHPVHLLRQQSRVERVQRVMLASPPPEAVRESKKIRFVNGIQHIDRRTLDDFVFQCRHSERPFPSVGLLDVYPTHRFGSIRSTLQPVGEILEVGLQGLAVVLPRLSVHTGRSFLLETKVGHAKHFRSVDVVQERCELQLLILACCLTYPLQRTRRVTPARSPGRVLLGRVPFGQTPSLHPLRGRFSGVVRGLRRYYRSVRLPVFVRHRRTSLDFPMRPQASSAPGERGISRFPCEVLPYVHGVSDRAGPRCALRYRRLGWCLPHSPTPSASRSEILSRLNTRPIRSPVNASTPPLREPPHDSGPMWVASPSSYDSFIHYTSPVLPAHRRISMTTN